MIQRLYIALALCLFATTATAGLDVGTDAPPGTPLNMDAGTVSGSMFLTTYDDGNPVNCQGWQVTLVIIPGGGATGSVAFNSPATGTPPDPVNYIFQATTSFGISATNTTSQLLVFDLEFPAGAGVPVPLFPGVNLVEMDFSATIDATGTFGIYALPLPNSEWTAAFEPVNFNNLLAGQDRIGEIVVSPPVANDERSWGHIKAEHQ